MNMAIEIIPLGAPQVGMTRAEMLTAFAQYGEAGQGIMDTVITLLFAYVVAMYIAGRQLTRLQYTIANVMYLTIMFSAIFGLYRSGVDQALWMERAWGEYSLSNLVQAVPVVKMSLFSIVTLLSIWFGSKIRHPTSELPQ
jgi:hypothetical protein